MHKPRKRKWFPAATTVVQETRTCNPPDASAGVLSIGLDATALAVPIVFLHGVVVEE